MAELVLTFELFPGHTLTLALFKDCTVAKELRAAVADTATPQVAFINANLVVDPWAVHLAGHKALAAQAAGKLVTRNVHTELLYHISGSKHVAESLKRFGITDDSTCILMARFDCTAEELQHLTSLVKGTPVPLSDLASLTDVPLVDKFYKLSKQELALQGRTRADAVVFRIAAKEYA